MTILFLSLMAVFGWFIFSLAAGIKMYFISRPAVHPKYRTRPGEKDFSAGKPREKIKKGPALETIPVVLHNGITIGGYYYPSADKNGGEYENTAVFVVPAPGDSLPDLTGLLEEYHKRGISVYVPDFAARAAERKSGTFPEMYTLSDKWQWYEHVFSEYKPERVFFHTFSSSGQDTLELISRNRFPLIKGFVADSPFFSYRKILDHYLRPVLYNRILRYSIILGARIADYLFSGRHFSYSRALRKLKRHQLPAVFLCPEKEARILEKRTGKIKYSAAAQRSIKPSPRINRNGLKLDVQMIVIPEVMYSGCYEHSCAHMQEIEEFIRRSK
ncbi:hypothetical protein K7I13_08440 [Brucepastera parasyntrophica]|uniref:hypothetical protein n=1 Tax=Brucepastera parasyntrophica TaxID=2880008 RepID=UPI00210CDD4F|nr:hypothetical protein [Brucepastera parasyntrophica]ULQ58597.1 hypothetical protein K7I13_08440 [Brucepastera parasyntrophica]